MPQPDRSNHRSAPELVFLGTSGAIQIRAFFYSCEVCEAVRGDPKHRPTRACTALVGREVMLVDASPDLQFQLEREATRYFHRIFILVAGRSYSERFEYKTSIPGLKFAYDGMRVTL